MCNYLIRYSYLVQSSPSLVFGLIYWHFGTSVIMWSHRTHSIRLVITTNLIIISTETTTTTKMTMAAVTLNIAYVVYVPLAQSVNSEFVWFVFCVFVRAMFQIIPITVSVVSSLFFVQTGIQSMLSICLLRHGGGYGTAAIFHTIRNRRTFFSIPNVARFRTCSHTN